MSYAAIRTALESRLNAMTPSLATAWENATFTPPSTAYQRINLLPAETENPEFGRMKRERGIFQVMLCYPANTGPKDAIARAELIRAQFARKTSMVSGSVTVQITKTPSIAPAIYEPGLYVIPVSIPYQADVFN